MRQGSHLARRPSTVVTYPPPFVISDTSGMAKPIEMYVSYLRDSGLIGNRKFAKIHIKDLRLLVKRARLHIHRPDPGTGVVVIHAYKKRNDPRQYPKKTVK